MRILMIAVAAILLMLPAAKQANACGAAANVSAQATATDLSAASHKKPVKKKVVKKKKEKVEYMRSAAGPEPVVKKSKKARKAKTKKTKKK